MAPMPIARPTPAPAPRTLAPVGRGRRPARPRPAPARRLAAALALAAPLAVSPLAAQRAAGPPQDPTALHALFDAYWAWVLEENPLTASSTGVRDHDHRLDDPSEAAEMRRLAALREFRARAEAMDTAGLPRGEQVNLAIFRRVVGDGIREREMRTHLMPFTTFVPFYSALPEMGERMRLDDARGYRDYAARLAAVGGYVDRVVALMREGLRSGITIPRVVLEGVEDDLAAHVVDDPEASRFWTPLESIPDGIPAAERDALREAARHAIRTSVVPGYRRFRDFIVEEYRPVTRTSIGISEVPGGRDIYRHRVRASTTLDVTPDEVHERGLAEVARIRSEMAEVMARAEFEGSFEAFLAFLRDDPRFYADSPEALLEKNALALKRMDGELPRLFGTLPRTPYGIRPIPDYMAPRMTTAYYSPPSADGTRAGFYYVNTYDLDARPLYEVQALAFHEAVPGHHLQNALAQEQGEVPTFRRFAGFTAFGEGWALYAERLGLEVGFYQDPHDDFGRLSYEMWRALRLVVDTGIHWKGWSRERAVSTMAENSALSLRNIEAEVDRYISWPGQALGYKMGELAIRDLRADAEARLGARFDVRAFHDVVLGSGEVPLQVLQENVERWVAGVEAGPG